MKRTEGKYEKRWRHTDNYYAWLDLLHVVAMTMCIAVIAACLIMLLFILMNPRVATAGDIVNFRTAHRMAAAVIQSEKVTTRAAVPVKIIRMEVSAYAPTVAECDGNPTRTASGKTVYVGGIAADLRVLPFGSIVIIPNYNGGKPCMVIDTGGAIKGNKLDVFFWHSQDAVNWGRRRNVPVQILYIPKE